MRVPSAVLAYVTRARALPERYVGLYWQRGKYKRGGGAMELGLAGGGTAVLVY